MKQMRQIEEERLGAVHVCTDFGKARHPLADFLQRRAADLAVACNPVVGAHFDQRQARVRARFVRGPLLVFQRRSDRPGVGGGPA